MIVTIDGPAGAGKSTVARALAARLGFRFLDTGAMYRAVALAGMKQGHDWDDTAGLVELAQRVRIELDDDAVRLDGQDVTAAIRTTEVTELIHYAAANPGVRKHLVALQRQIGVGADLVTEGRDQGTVAFPDATCKIFLTASPEERARRRVADLASRGERVTFEEVLAQQALRDERDASRDVGPLKPADDAIEVLTDGLTQEQVVDRLVSLVEGI
jgi:cytidylate kinase/pantoate ligase/cytidylate kinase